MNVFSSFWGRVKNFLFPQAVVQREFGAPSAVSKTMEQNIGLWYSLYSNRPPWQTEDVKPLGLPSAICRELSRPTLSEFHANISGSKRADYLAERFAVASEGFQRALELGAALGGVAFKPYIYGGELFVDVTGAAGFTPTKFDPSGRCVGGVFKDKPVKKDGKYYIRLEYHEFSGASCMIRNKAFYSDADGGVGAEAPLNAVEEWADLEPEMQVDNVTSPLFAYFKTPSYNSADANSACGMSVYGDAATVELLRQADEQWERLRWEFKSSERKIMFDGFSTAAEMYNDRLFEIGSFTSSGNLFQFIEPQIRDDALYRGIQNILRRIEFNVGLAYGDISDPQAVEKTATEIRNSKQRKYVLISTIQKELEHTFDSLLYAMDVYASLYNLAPVGEYEATYDWGDSILDDEESKEKEFARDMQMLSAGILNDWEFRAKHMGEDEETAKASLPKAQDVTDEEEQEVE